MPIFPTSWRIAPRRTVSMYSGATPRSSAIRTASDASRSQWPCRYESRASIAFASALASVGASRRSRSSSRVRDARSSASATAVWSSACANGLVTRPAAPRVSAWLSVSYVPAPVTSTTGSDAWRLRAASSSSSPERPGMTTSLTTRSNSPSSSRSSACSALSAPTTSWPTDSRISTTSMRITSSSSIARMRLIGRPPSASGSRTVKRAPTPAPTTRSACRRATRRSRG